MLEAATKRLVELSAEHRVSGRATSLLARGYNAITMRNFALVVLTCSPVVAQHQLLTLPKEHGVTLAAAGDVNGDGFADVLVGNSSGLSNSAPTGSAVLVSGRDGRILYRLVGDRRGDQFGSACAGIGDIDGDRVPDLLIAATSAPYDSSTNQRGSGRVYLVSGAKGRRLQVLSGPSNAERYGRVVAALGDVDKDGVPDFAVGERTNSSTGSVYVYSGKTRSLLRRHWDAGWEFGIGVAPVGDMSKDGAADYVIGHPRGRDSSNKRVGFARVYSGATGSWYTTAWGTGKSSDMGKHLSGAGDQDGDGTLDFAASSSSEDRVGAVFVFSGKTGAVIRTFKGRGQGYDGGFGQSLVAPGDLTGDGIVDFLIGVRRIEISQNDRHAVAVVDGKKGSVLRYIGEQIGLVVGVGDVNRDGSPDFGCVRNRLPALMSSKPLLLTSSSHESSILYRTPQVLDAWAGKSNANKVALLIGSASGVHPGVRIGALHVPLNVDAYTGLTLSAPHAVVFNNFAKIGADGRAKFAFVPPAGLSASMAGLVLHHAYLILEAPLKTASNAVVVRLKAF